MKTLAAVAIAMMIVSTSSASDRNCFSDSATYARFGAAKAAEFYVPALSSSNEGVVESALAHLAMIKLNMPGCELRSVKAGVRAIERKGMSAEVRYKAWVVRTLMERPELFEGIARSGYDGPDELFGALASRMAEYYAAH
jgi:hypothetical protein